MNAQSYIQNFDSSRSPLYRIEEQESPLVAFTQQPMDTFGGIHQVASKNIHFIARIKELIEMNMDDENYGIDQLCRDAGASRSQLHNKIKKWTGLSTTYYIRSVRLQRAKYLLVHTDLNITQVAFEVGFRDPSYFTRVFDDSFGICPKNFRKRWQKTYSMA
ncbi:MAG: AraC family transcriptional regulator [Saprospiraceae bacterium]